MLELIIVVAILPLIVGAIAVALISTFQLQASVSNRLAASGDAQVVSANFFHDVQTATLITTAPTPLAPPTKCGSAGPQLLGLEWFVSPVNAAATVVSYEEAPNGVTINGIEQNNLVRVECSYSSTGGLTQTGSSTISHDVPSGLSASISGISCALAGAYPCSLSSPTPPWATSWASTVGVTAVGITVNAAATSTNSGSSGPACPSANPTNPSTYCFTVVAAPRQWAQLSSCGSGAFCPSNLGSAAPPLLLLGGSDGSSLTCNNSGSVNVSGSIVLDQTTSGAIRLGDNATVSATISIITASSPASNTVSGGNSTSVTPAPISGPPAADPYATWTPPNGASPALEPTRTGHGRQAVTTYYPGIYKHTLKIHDHVNAVFVSGIYIFEQGARMVKASSIAVRSTSASSGVLFYNKGGSLSLGGRGGVNLTPLTPSPYNSASTGYTTGLTIWQNVTDTNSISIGGSGDHHGSATFNISGTVYAPGATVAASGNATLNIGQLVAQRASCGGSPFNITG